MKTNKKLVMLATGLMIVFAGFHMSFKAFDQETVAIVHKPNTPAEQILNVPKSAVQAHLNHGDRLLKICTKCNTPKPL